MGELVDGFYDFFSCLVGGIRGGNGSGAGIQIRRKTINVDPSKVRKIGW